MHSLLPFPRMYKTCEAEVVTRPFATQPPRTQHAMLVLTFWNTRFKSRSERLMLTQRP